MRASLREDILDTAVALFNDRGYSNVSLRAISGALGISVGNLNYHFQKKQDILQAIMERNYIAVASDTPITTLRQFQSLWERMLDSLLLYAFYFRDPSLARLHPKGPQDMDFLRQMTLQALDQLQQAGLFSPELTPQRQDQLVRVLMLSHLGWVQQLDPVSGRPAISKEVFLAHHWALLEPYLTPAGREEYQRTLQTPTPQD